MHILSKEIDLLMIFVIVPISPADYVELDDSMRQTLIFHKIHLEPACKERLYLPRKEIVRGLSNIVHKFCGV